MKDPNRSYRTRAALFRLKPIRTANKHLSLASKAQLVRTFILSTFLDACERMARTYVSVKEVRKEIQNAIEKHNDPLTMVKNHKVI